MLWDLPNPFNFTVFHLSHYDLILYFLKPSNNHFTAKANNMPSEAPIPSCVFAKINPIREPPVIKVTIIPTISFKFFFILK